MTVVWGRGESSVPEGEKTACLRSGTPEFRKKGTTRGGEGTLSGIAVVEGKRGHQSPPKGGGGRGKKKSSTDEEKK